MRLSGVTNLEFSGLTIDDFSPNDRRCSNCLTPFKEGDKLVVIFSGATFMNRVVIAGDEFFVVHVKNPDNPEESCVEEFVSKAILHLPAIPLAGEDKGSETPSGA